MCELHARLGRHPTRPSSLTRNLKSASRGKGLEDELYIVFFCTLKILLFLFCFTKKSIENKNKILVGIFVTCWPGFDP